MTDILTDEQVAKYERITKGITIPQQLIATLRHVQAELAYWKGHEVIQILNDEISKARKENVRLREALEFYGNRDNWQKENPSCMHFETPWTVANKALATEGSSNTVPDERMQAALWFAEQMNVKLQENVHKGGWHQCNQYWLLERLQEEVFELAQAMGKAQRGELDKIEVIREAADVGNFAMMIADKCRLGRD